MVFGEISSNSPYSSHSQLCWYPCLELIRLNFGPWRNIAIFVKFATLLVPFACIRHFDKILPNLSHSPKSSNPPTWQASMCLADLHLFRNLAKSCQIYQRYDCGKISSTLPNFAKFVTFAKIVKSTNMAGFHVFSLFAFIWEFGEILPNSPPL